MLRYTDSELDVNALGRACTFIAMGIIALPRVRKDEQLSRILDKTPTPTPLTQKQFNRACKPHLNDVNQLLKILYLDAMTFVLQLIELGKDPNLVTYFIAHIMHNHPIPDENYEDIRGWFNETLRTCIEQDLDKLENKSIYDEIKVGLLMK